MIVVTTPTGRIGRELVERLLDRQQSVRVLVRDPSRLDPAVRERVEVVEGSHEDHDVLSSALRDADALFWVVPPDPTSDDVDGTYLRFGEVAARAITAQAVPRVVAVSSLGREDEPAGLLSAAIEMDRLLRETGAGVRVLRTPFFMENLLGQVGPIAREGTIRLTNRADRELLLVATRDVAAQAAELLCDDSWSGQADVDVVSADRLDPDAMARVVSDVLGRSVRFRHVEPDAFVDMLTDSGVSRAWARGIVEMTAAQDRDFYDVAARGTTSPGPTSFQVWCEEVLAPALPT